MAPNVMAEMQRGKITALALNAPQLIGSQSISGLVETNASSLNAKTSAWQIRFSHICNPEREIASPHLCGFIMRHHQQAFRRLCSLTITSIIIENGLFKMAISPSISAPKIMRAAQLGSIRCSISTIVCIVG